MVTAILYTCTALLKTGASNQITLFAIKKYLAMTFTSIFVL